MDLHLTRDQQEIVESAASYLEQKLPASRAPKLDQGAMSDSEWRGLADMGWFTIALPEEAGGLGLTVVEECLVVREFGRNLVPPSAVATVIAVHLANDAGDQALVEALATGGVRAAIAISADGSPDPTDGPYHFIDADHADVVVVWSRTGLVLADRGMFDDLRPVEPLDFTIPTMTGRASGLDRARRPADGQAMLWRARLFCAALLTGGAEASRDISVDYAKTRHQFGRPIGGFQAIGHRCADMAVECEAAWATLQYASVCARDETAEAPLYTAAAKAVASDAANKCAAWSMQIFGGYGQTYDFLPHFFLKRAMIYNALGDVAASSYEDVLTAPRII